MKRTPLTRRTPLARVSRKLKGRLVRYYELRRKFLEANPVCQFPGCEAQATEVHHKAGRGKNLNAVETWMSICRTHHQATHLNPSASRKAGLLL